MAYVQSKAANAAWWLIPATQSCRGGDALFLFDILPSLNDFPYFYDKKYYYYYLKSKIKRNYRYSDVEGYFKMSLSLWGCDVGE